LREEKRGIRTTLVTKLKKRTLDIFTVFIKYFVISRRTRQLSFKLFVRVQAHFPVLLILSIVQFCETVSLGLNQTETGMITLSTILSIKAPLLGTSDEDTDESRKSEKIF
jgi:hypothetical protein